MRIADGSVASCELIWPRGITQLIEFYGNPDRNEDLHADPVWEQEYLTVLTLPFPMRLSWGDNPTVTTLKVHRRCGWAMIAALDQFRLSVGVEAIRENGWDMLGGCYNFRAQTGSKAYLSVHSWAAAIDINPHLGAFGVKPTQPPELVEAFEFYGAQWAGRWPEMNPAWPYDGMHFQFCSGY